MDLGERIRNLRTEQGMTLEGLGRRLGKSKQYMSELERGHIRLTYEMAVAIASVFKTSPDGIFMPIESKKLGHAKEASANG